MKRKIRIEIDYNRIIIDQVSVFMSHCDLDIEKIGFPPMIITFTTSVKVDKKYKQKMIEQIKEHFKNEFVIYDIKIFDEGTLQKEVEI